MKINLKKLISRNDLPRKKGEKVVVAMSGGVDSSVTAVLLHKAGYEIIGVTMQLYKNVDSKSRKSCCAGIDISDAKSVADQFGFKHYTLNYENRFKNSVIDNFLDSYNNAETPIPCIRCNQTVKFVDLINFTKSVGSSVLATGHYVRRIKKKSKIELHQAKDMTKDQSYFLFSTSRNQLEFLRFPLGDFSKREIRQFALELNITNAEKPDSQDICFIPNGNYRDFYISNRPDSIKGGIIETYDGKVVGQHLGIINYTIGQRKGLGIGGISGNNHSPLYVLEIDKKNNKIIVGPREKLAKYKIYVKDVNLIQSYNKKKILDVEVKVRSGESKISANITLGKSLENTCIVELDKPEFGIAPGQACVFYDQNKVLGGGWIFAAEKNLN